MTRKPKFFKTGDEWSSISNDNNVISKNVTVVVTDGMIKDLFTRFLVEKYAR